MEIDELLEKLDNIKDVLIHFSMYRGTNYKIIEDIICNLTDICNQLYQERKVKEKEFQ